MYVFINADMGYDLHWVESSLKSTSFKINSFDVGSTAVVVFFIAFAFVYSEKFQDFFFIEKRGKK